VFISACAAGCATCSEGSLCESCSSVYAPQTASPPYTCGGKPFISPRFVSFFRLASRLEPQVPNVTMSISEKLHSTTCGLRHICRVPWRTIMLQFDSYNTNTKSWMLSTSDSFNRPTTSMVVIHITCDLVWLTVTF